MANFDEAVIHETVNSVQPMVKLLDEAQHECQEAIRHVQALGERLQADRQELRAAVEVLAHDAASAEQTLSAQAEAASATLGRVAGIVGLAATEWPEVFHAEEQALAGGAELLPQLGQRVHEITEKAEAATRGVLEWAGEVKQHLEQAVTGAEQLVSENVAAKLAVTCREAVLAIATGLIDLLQKQGEDPIGAKEAECQPKLQQIHEFFDRSFEALAAKEEALASDVVERLDQVLEAETTSTQTVAQALAEGLSSLAQAATNDEGGLTTAAQMLAQHQDQVASGAASLAGDLLAVRGQWATYGIG